MICQCCNKDTDELKKLPCGFYCVDCYNEIGVNLDKELNSFECPYCELVHSLKEYLEMDDQEDGNIIMQKNIDDLKKKIDQLQIKIDGFNFELLNSDQKIHDYCEKLKNDVQIATEIRIKEIQDLSEVFFKKIDDYETKCLKSLQNREMGQIRFSNFITKSENKHKEIYDYINNNQTNLDQLTKMNDLTNDLIKKFDIEIKKYHDYIYDHELMQFISNPVTFNDRNLGKFITKSLHDTINQNTRWLTVNSFDRDKILLSDYFQNGTFVAAHMEEPKSFHLYVIAEDGLLKHSKTFACSWFQRLIGTKISKIQLKTNKNMLVVYYELFSNYSKTRNLLVLDSELKEIKKELVNFEIDSIRANNSYIVCYSKSSKPLVLVYDWSLEIMKQIGQSEDSFQPFFFSGDIISVDYLNKKIYCFYEDRFEIMDEENGLIISFVEIRADYFMFDSIGLFNLFAFSMDTMLITEFSIDGEYLDVIKLNRPLKKANVSINKDDIFIFFGKNLDFVLF